VLASVRPRQDLVRENLLLRHQLAVLTRPTRARPRARLRTWDKVLWVLARRFWAGWREHLAIVTPETVVRWPRQGWRRFWRWKSRSRARVRGLRQPGPIASHARPPDARAEATPDDRSDPVTAGAERAASCLRARRRPYPAVAAFRGWTRRNARPSEASPAPGCDAHGPGPGMDASPE